MNLLRRTKAFLYDGGPWSGIVRRVRPRALVLVYHRVAEAEFDPFHLAVPPALFDAHLRALRQHFTPMALDELLARMESGDCPDGAVAVTFDDGYADNLHAAQPIAAAHEVPLTVFVTAGPVLDGTGFWWDDLTCSVAALRGQLPVHVEAAPETTFAFGGAADPTPELRALHRVLMGMPAKDSRRTRLLARLSRAAGERSNFGATGRPLTRSELEEIASRPGIEIGAHSISHPSLRILPEEDRVREIEEGRALLETVLGRPVKLLSYPFGRPRDVDEVSIHIAGQSGYRAAFTTSEGCVTPRGVRSRKYALPRVTIYQSTPDGLVARIRGVMEYA